MKKKKRRKPNSNSYAFKWISEDTLKILYPCWIRYIANVFLRYADWRDEENK